MGPAAIDGVGVIGVGNGSSDVLQNMGFRLPQRVCATSPSVGHRRVVVGDTGSVESPRQPVG